MEDLNKKMAAGVAWMTTLRLAVKILGLASTIVLARLLVPADFGLVAMATSVTALLELITYFGFDVPLIQNQKADRRHFDTAWTLNVCFFGALTVILLLSANTAATFYNDQRLVDIIYVLAIAFVAKGFENTGVVEFRKQLNFRMEFLLMFSKKLASVAIAIPLALYFRSYWALVIGMVASNVLGVMLTYYVHPFRPRISFHYAADMIGFSKWLVLNNFTGFLRIRSPDFIIGRISGNSALGVFSLAYEIATLPTSELVGPINRAIFPGYAKLAEDRDLLRKSYIDVLSIVALLALPVSLGLSAVSQPLVLTVLGPNWSDAAPIISILAIFAGIQAIQTNSGSVFNAIGKPYLVSIVAVSHVVLLIPGSIVLALEYGPFGVAYAYVIVHAMLSPLSFFMVCRQINLSFWSVASALIRPLLGSLAMFGLVIGLRDYLTEPGASPALILLLLIPFGAVVYGICMLLMWVVAGRPHSPDYRIAVAGLNVLRRRLSAKG